jgi:hypothetical protein
MMKYWSSLISILLFSLSCAQDDGSVKKVSEKEIQEISAGGSKISDIIRNPIDADKSIDTVNVAKLVFEETIYRFGKVKEGTVVKHSFDFINEGKVPLIITNAKSTCGCTISDWPKGVIAPGKGGQIDVRFDTKNKIGQQAKPITITANTYPQSTVLKMAGTVME